MATKIMIFDMNHISLRKQLTCFDAIFELQSWLPEPDEHKVHEKIRMIALETLLTCQKEFAKTVQEIIAVPENTNDYYVLAELLKKLKVFNRQTEIVDSFLSSPLGERLLPKKNLLEITINKRLTSNFQTIEKYLQSTLEKLIPYIELNNRFPSEFFEDIFSKRYACQTFAPLYVKLLMEKSTLQVKDWLRSNERYHRLLTTFRCDAIQKIFIAFETNLNQYSYPHGFINENIRLIKYVNLTNAIPNPEVLDTLRKIESAFGLGLYGLIDLKTAKEIKLLHEIARLCSNPQFNKKQLGSFLKGHKNKETLLAYFKRFKLFARNYPKLKSHHWIEILDLYENQKKLFLALKKQGCLHENVHRLEKFVKLGIHDPHFLNKILQLMQIAYDQSNWVFSKIAKRCSYKQLLALKPIISLANDSNSTSLILKALAFFAEDFLLVQPLLNIPESKRAFLLVVFEKMQECSQTEIETIFGDHSELHLFKSLYSPYSVNNFSARMQVAVRANPELERHFEAWLGKAMQFLQDKKEKVLSIQNRSIVLRALEMKSAHLVPFFKYASKNFHYRHLSHLLYLEKKCPKRFLDALSLTEQQPLLLSNLTCICNRLGPLTTSRLIRLWKTKPETITKILVYRNFSKCFFEGFFQFSKTNPTRIQKYLQLIESVPQLILRIDQDLHLISERFLDQLVQDKSTAACFEKLIQASLPYMISNLIRKFCEGFEDHQKIALKILQTAHRNPFALLHLIQLASHSDLEVASFLSCCEKQPSAITYKLMMLLEHEDDRDLAKTLCTMFHHQMDKSFALKLLDLAMEGYRKEANELANKYVCYQFNSLNKFLFGLAESQNGHLISSLLRLNDSQKRTLISHLDMGSGDLQTLARLICGGHYRLVDFLRNKSKGSIIRPSRDFLVSEHIKKRNFQMAEWLLTHEMPSKTPLTDMIKGLLDCINKTSFYHSSDKHEALEVGLSVATALSIMSPSGVINRFIFPKIRKSILGQSYIPSECDAIVHILNVLNILEEDVGDISIKFIRYERPKVIKNAARNILSCFFEEEQTEDFRYCVLSALLMRPRQHNLLGNCFACQLSIQSSSDPKGLSLAIDDYFDILSTGSLKRPDPLNRQMIEYKLSEQIQTAVHSHPTDHPLQRARELLLTQMGSDIYAQKLLCDNIALVSPKARHNYLFRALQNSGLGDYAMLLSTSQAIQQSFRKQSDSYYDPNIVDPATKTSGAWRLVRKSSQNNVLDYDDYLEFLKEAIQNAKSDHDENQNKLLEYLLNYLSSSSHFKEKLLTHYKHRKFGRNSTHWLDYSGGIAEGVRLRYYNYHPSVHLKTSRYIYSATDAIIEIFAFLERLSDRVHNKILKEKHFKLPIEYPNHCANLTLNEFKFNSASEVLDTIASEIEAVRNVFMQKTTFEELIESFKAIIGTSVAPYWANLMYQNNFELMTVGQFCDHCMDALNKLCVDPLKQANYIAAWENTLRQRVPRCLPSILRIIDTNWKDYPFDNVYLGVGGSILYKKPIFFHTSRGVYQAQVIHFAKGQWDFVLPINL